MSETFDEKLEQFERLWDGVTPKGINRTKSLKFRQYMRQHVLQKYHKRRKEQFSSADKGHYNHSFSSRIDFSLRRTAVSTGWGNLKEISESESF